MAIAKGKKPHVLAVPFPAQGHVKPLMKFCYQLAKHGIKVTFVNIQYIHDKLLSAAKLTDYEHGNFVLTSIPNGADPTDTFKLLEVLRDTMPGYVADKIEEINSSDADERITCVIFDITISWIAEIAEKMGAESVTFSPPSAAALVLLGHIPVLLEEDKLDSNGNIINGETMSLSEEIPSWRSHELSWTVCHDINTQKIFFDTSVRISKLIKECKWLLSNTFYELEPAACDLNPNLLPIGPLLEANIQRNTCTSFHLEDDSCLGWLNSKPPGSVIYVSFGSLAVFSQLQLDELALGLELSRQAFLWVVRSDLANGSQAVFPDRFLEKLESSGIGKIVEWAPQEKVLNHPAIACFVSHCGWNSTLEGTSSGVPILCWPYFSDQYHNQNYICDKWETGLRIEPDENGIRSRNEIKNKIDMLLSDAKFKVNAVRLKEMAVKSVSESGSSLKNLVTFISHLRD